jgi:hypothetical protein
LKIKEKAKVLRLGARSPTELRERIPLREELERQYVLGMDDGFQEGYKMGPQDGWSKRFDDGFEEAGRQFKETYNNTQK